MIHSVPIPKESCPRMCQPIKLKWKQNSFHLRLFVSFALAFRQAKVPRSGQSIKMCIRDSYEPFGIYAGKTTDLSALPDKATVLVPNHVTNERCV